MYGPKIELACEEKDMASKRKKEVFHWLVIGIFAFTLGYQVGYSYGSKKK
jgi:hypothetical protein